MIYINVIKINLFNLSILFQTDLLIIYFHINIIKSSRLFIVDDVHKYCK
jgi:hypothetical protein